MQKIRERRVTSAIERAGWSRERQISFREDEDFAYPLLDADYVLSYTPNIPIAIIVVTDSDSEVAEGIDRAIENAIKLDALFAFSSNGIGFAFWDTTKPDGHSIRQLDLDQFPTPEELWAIYLDYMQAEVASKEIVKEVRKGNNRILLGLTAVVVGVVATAFHIIKSIIGTDKRALYLTDRDDDWIGERDYWRRQYELQGKAFRDLERLQYENFTPLSQFSKNHPAGIYWASVNESTREDNRISLKDYPPDYFDVVVVDKNQDGDIASQAKWMESLKHFASSPQIAIVSDSTNNDMGYFTKSISIDSLGQNLADTLFSKYILPSGNESKLFHIIHNNMSVIENNTSIVNQDTRVSNTTTHNSFYNSSRIINKTEQHHTTINHNKTIINNTKMARQTSFSHQIELAERLKSYLHGFQERLGDVAQNYKSKCNDLFEAGMMEETFHEFENNYMHETIGKIANVITQINENDIPFIEKFIAYLEQNPSK